LQKTTATPKSILAKINQIMAKIDLILAIISMWLSKKNSFLFGVLRF